MADQPVVGKKRRLPEQFKPTCLTRNTSTRIILKVIKQGKPISAIEMTKRNCSILGRAKEMCDVVMEHESISRQHSAFLSHNNYTFVVDLSSAHGTKVNGSEIKPHRMIQVFDGDTLQFGASSRCYVVRTDLGKKKLSEAEEEEVTNELSSILNTALNKREIIRPQDPLPQPHKKRKRFTETKPHTKFEEEPMIVPREGKAFRGKPPSSGGGRFQGLVTSTLVPT